MTKPEADRTHASEPVTRRDHVVRLSFTEAAERLGITVAAVRMRVHRGTLESEHVGGERFVLVPAALFDVAEQRDERETHASERVRTTKDRDDVIAAKDSEIAYLRQSLEAEREARRRADTIIIELSRQVIALPAPHDAAVAANEGLQRTEPPAMTNETSASWWARLRRWVAGGAGEE
jgi:hypothetical protein